MCAKQKDSNGLPQRASQKLPVPVRKGGVPAKRRPSAPPKRRSTIDQYLDEIGRVPLLTREEEIELARRFRSDGDRAAARKLVESNLRFVVKVAHSYSHYNVKLTDLIQEGNIGLMRAVEKFNPDRGYRLISYAVWWIKAYMQNYVIRSWRMVRVGTAQMQRKLFFRRQTDKEELEHGVVDETLQEDGLDSDDRTVLVPAHVRKRKADDELAMAVQDFSLDAQIDSSDGMTHLDMLPSPDPQQEDMLAKREIMAEVSERIDEVVGLLGDKELYILNHRLLADEPETLQAIGERFGVSRERVRQIENGVKERIGKAVGSIEGVSEIV